MKKNEKIHAFRYLLNMKIDPMTCLKKIQDGRQKLNFAFCQNLSAYISESISPIDLKIKM